jgi:hypothetical protein
LLEPDSELDEVARVVVDAALEVHRLLGPGFVESVYEHALSVELTYKNVAIGEARLDLLVARTR